MYSSVCWRRDVVGGFENVMCWELLRWPKLSWCDKIREGQDYRNVEVESRCFFHILREVGVEREKLYVLHAPVLANIEG